MATSERISRAIVREIALGTWPVGTGLPGVRELAQTHGASASTVARVLRELAGANLVEVAPRRRARVLAGAQQRAVRWQRGTGALRLAGSDDPGLARLLTPELPVVRGSASGSAGGLKALWEGQVDAVTLHLSTARGDYNDPFVADLLFDRDPVLVHLWRREQGILIHPDRAGQITGLEDLPGHRLALRAPGTGTRSLLDQRARAAGIDPAELTGPVVSSHLDVALAVATDSVDAGIAVRAVADLTGLAFLPLTWEPFEIALPSSHLPLLEPLIEHLSSDQARRILLRLGYDPSASGQRRSVLPQR